MGQKDLGTIMHSEHTRRVQLVVDAHQKRTPICITNGPIERTTDSKFSHSVENHAGYGKVALNIS